jgi:CHAD domain-containing protein
LVALIAAKAFCFVRRKRVPLDEGRLQKSVGKVRKFLKKARKRPSPQEIHDLRTHARRFEATVEALAMNSRRNERRILQDLSRLRKRAGKIRDMDVLTGCAAKVHVDGEEDCSVQLLEYLGAKRYRQANKMRVLIRECGAELRQRLNGSAAQLRTLVGRAQKNESDTKASPPRDAMATAFQLSSALRTPARLDRRNLHPYRLKVKELRYVLQMSETADQQRFVEKLGQVKDAIGEWHDWEELVGIATELLDHGTDCKLLRELKSVSNRKYGDALSLTNSMRQTYLGSRLSNRKLTRPVLKAASAIGDETSS